MTQAQLLLWGEVAVGKSTLLATGLLSRPWRTNMIDVAASSREDDRSNAWDKVLKNWQALQENRSSLQTEGVSQLRVRLANGSQLTVRDVQGIMTRRVLEEESFRQPGVSQGVLFVCEWHGAEIAAHLRAVRDALPHCHGRAVGLALTKSERGLDATDPHWLAPPGWWAEHDCWKPYSDVLAAFGERVWPTTSFGFGGDGRPACLLNEFGEAVPFRVRPRNVEAPFLWFIKELGLWQE